MEWVGLGHAWESQYWRETAEEGACHSVGSLPVRSTELYSLLAQGHWPNLLSMLTPLPEQQLSEREQQLMEKSGDLLALQKEADGMRADFSLLRNQFLTERKKAEKQVAGLKEALKIQRSQLEKNLLVSKLPWESREKQHLHQPDTHISHLHCFPVEKRNYPSTQALTPMVETQ